MSKIFSNTENSIICAILFLIAFVVQCSLTQSGNSVSKYTIHTYLYLISNIV